MEVQNDHLQIVSILGLARSPTSYLRSFRLNSGGFNTWAREEPNMIL